MPSAAATTAAASCGQGGTLVMARKEEPLSLVPWSSIGNGNIFFQVQIYDRLVEAMPDVADPQPGLAESWEISTDGLSYTFHLRQAKFSNGDAVTAEDVKFSLDRMIDAKVQVDWAFLMTNIKGFEIVDPSTIRMDMKAIDASILYTLTMPPGSIYSKAAYESMGEEAFAKSPVGSGPFMLKAWTLGQSIEIERNPNHWRSGQPYLDGIKFLYVPDSNARALKAQSGEADIVEEIPFEQVAQIDALDNVAVQVEPKMVGWYILLNNLVKPFDEKVVRQALNYATPKDVINEVALAGKGMVSNSMIVQRGRFWDDTVQPYPFDIEKAKSLLAQSSVPNGFDMELIIPAGQPGPQQMAQIVQSEWKKLGINVKITVIDTAVFWDRVPKADYQAAAEAPTSMTSDSYDDNEIASIFLDYSDAWKSFFTNWKSDEASRLVRAANSTVDVAERQALYSQLQQYAMDEAPWVTLLNAPSTNAVADKVTGFKTLPLGWWRLENVCLTQ